MGSKGLRTDISLLIANIHRIYDLKADFSSLQMNPRNK